MIFINNMFKFKNINKIKNESGSAILWVLGAAAVVAVISAALPQLFTANERDFKINHLRNSIPLVKESLIAMLDNDAVWAETLNHNGSLDCLKTAGQICPSGVNGNFDVYDADGTQFLSQSATSGLTLSGKPCDQFDAINGHPTCVLKFDLSWECNGACVPTAFDSAVTIANKPALKLKAKLLFSPKDKKIKTLIDEQSTAYTFDVLRGSHTKTLSGFCNSIAGVFNQQTQTCDSSKSEPGTFNCVNLMGPLLGPHSIFVGFNVDGSPKCAASAYVNAYCSAGQAILGYNSDGGIICGAF